MTQVAHGIQAKDSMDAYFCQIKDHELLTKEQEHKLVLRYQHSEDYDAAERLVRANLRLVVKIARECYNRGGRFPLNDLIQQGNLGLMYAVNRFDHRKKTKFSYYATFWIKAFIYKYLIDNYSSVRIGKTQAQRKLFFRLGKTKEDLRRNGLPVTSERIANRIGVKADEVEQMESRMGQQDQSLNVPCHMRTKEQLIDQLEDDYDSVEDTLANRQLHSLLHRIIAKFKSKLNARELDILELRIVAQDPVTLQKLGEHFGVSRERIRQIEGNIIKKLRSYLKAEIPDFEYYLAG